MLGSINNLMTVDPGNITGIAVWKTGIIPYKTLDIRIKLAVGDPLDVDECVRQMAEKFTQLFQEDLNDCRPEIVYIEGVRVYNTLKSMTSAMRGNLMWLSYLVGAYTQIVHGFGAQAKIIEPSQWKGQMNKTAVKRRIERRIGMVYRNEHITDAVGMGLSIAGIL